MNLRKKSAAVLKFVSLVAEFVLCTKSIHCIDEGNSMAMLRNKAKCLMSFVDLRPFASDMVLARPQFPE